MSHHRVTNPDIEGDIPGEVIQFLKDFDSSLKAKDVPALQSLYETTLPQLSAQFYSNKVARGQDRQPFRAWPAVKYVKSHFSTPTMEKVYTMVYYRHLYTDRSVHPSVRVKSWETFQDLITVLIKASQSENGSNDSIDLPNGLLWDIFDEMLFQLQSLFNQKSRSVTQGKDWSPGTWDISVMLSLFDDIIYGDAELSNGGDVASVVVPDEAVQRIGQEPVIFVDTGDGLRPVPVSVGRKNRTHVEILSGLMPGQRHVVEGAFELKAKIVTAGLGAHAGHGH